MGGLLTCLQLVHRLWPSRPLPADQPGGGSSPRPGRCCSCWPRGFRQLPGAGVAGRGQPVGPQPTGRACPEVSGQCAGGARRGRARWLSRPPPGLWGPGMGHTGRSRPGSGQRHRSTGRGDGCPADGSPHGRFLLTLFPHHGSWSPSCRSWDARGVSSWMVAIARTRALEQESALRELHPP